MTLEYKDGWILASDGHGNGTEFYPGCDLLSLKLVGRTVVVKTADGRHYEYDGAWGAIKRGRGNADARENSL